MTLSRTDIESLLACLESGSSNFPTATLAFVEFSTSEVSQILLTIDNEGTRSGDAVLEQSVEVDPE